MKCNRGKDDIFKSEVTKRKEKWEESACKKIIFSIAIFQGQIPSNFNAIISLIFSINKGNTIYNVIILQTKKYQNRSIDKHSLVQF